MGHNTALLNKILAIDPDFEQKDMVARLQLRKALEINDYSDLFQWHGRAIPEETFRPNVNIYLHPTR